MGNSLAQTKNLVFIGGTGRCGTNLLKNTLSLHSQVAALPFEYRFIIDPDGIIDYYNGMTTTWSPYIAHVKIKRLRNFLNAITKKSPWHHPLNLLLKRLNPDGKKISLQWYHQWELQKWLPNFEKHVNHLMAQLVQFDYSACWPGTESYSLNNRLYFASAPTQQQLASQLGGFISDCVQDYLQLKEKSCFVEDNTWNILFAKELFELLPQVKLIHIYRDPRDVIASFIRQRWCPSNLQSAITYYRAIIQKWLMIKPTLPAHRFLEVRFEEFVAQPEKVLNQICLFTQLPLEEKIYTGDFSKSNIGRWRVEFSPSQQEILQQGVQDIVEHLHYNS